MHTNHLFWSILYYCIILLAGGCERCRRREGCECTAMYYQCVQGGCVPLHAMCDGVRDCTDNSDETICNYNTVNRTSVSGSDSKVTESRSGPLYCSTNNPSLGTYPFERHCVYERGDNGKFNGVKFTEFKSHKL